MLKNFRSAIVAILALVPLSFATACSDDKPATESPLVAMVGEYLEDIGDDDGRYYELSINADMTGAIGSEGANARCRFVERDGQPLMVVEATDEYNEFPIGEYALTIIDADTLQVEGPWGPLTFRRFRH